MFLLDNKFVFHYIAYSNNTVTGQQCTRVFFINNYKRICMCYVRLNKILPIFSIYRRQQPRWTSSRGHRRNSDRWVSVSVVPSSSTTGKHIKESNDILIILITVSQLFLVFRLFISHVSCNKSRLRGITKHIHNINIFVVSEKLQAV